MAMVREMRTSNGARVRFFDDAYINATPEEIARRRREASEAAYNILVAAAKRKQQEEQVKET